MEGRDHVLRFTFHASRFRFALMHLCAYALMLFLGNAEAVRIKDIAKIERNSEEFLFGYGLVVGLKGTGDRMAVAFTPQTVSNMLKKMGIDTPQEAINVKNVAAVMITARMNGYVKAGSRIDVFVSSMGDAISLKGGTLLPSNLLSLDGSIAAVADGAVVIGEGDSATVGTILAGAVVKKAPSQDGATANWYVHLNAPDFTTAARIADAINSKAGQDTALAVDPETVLVKVQDSAQANLVQFISSLETIDVNPDSPARVVINRRTGVVVIDGNVKVSEVAVSFGNISVSIGMGNEEPAEFKRLPSNVTMQEFVDALNAIGASTAEIISILEAIKKLGALHAELIIF